MIIGLISCVNKKKDTRCKAKEMYISPWFKKGYEYLSYRCDKIFIMSAKYGLLSPETYITPYNQTLLKMSKEERKKWSYEILKELKRNTNFQNDRFVILGGVKYTEYICQKIPHYEIPLQAMEGGHGILCQLHHLNKWNKEYKSKKR